MALRLAFDLFVPPEMGETRALIVMKNGRIVAERYAEGYHENTRFISWSMAKTVTAVMIGELVADGRLRELQSGHGLVVDVRLGSLVELAPQLDDRDQTLVQHGFSREALVALLDQLGNRALDRIVPFGRALDFHPVWDGTDLLDVLTRKITLPGN